MTCSGFASSQGMSLSISSDVLREVFKYLEPRDLLNVNLSCRYFRELSDPLVYRIVYLKWEDIDYISRLLLTEEPDYRVQHIRKAFIAPSGRGEWNSSPRLSLLEAGSNYNLAHLHISCALRSSGWLKYVEFPLISVRKLELVTSGPYVNYAFDFDHVAYNFPSLESIVLGDAVAGFMIDLSSGISLPHLQHIKVQNCEWQYPTNLVAAAADGKLESLQILVTQHMHPFAFSERLQNEIAMLPSSLRTLTVWLDVGKRLSWNPLQKTKKLPNLTSATVHGFDYKYRTSPGNDKFPLLKALVES